MLSLEELTHRYCRLRRELGEAYAAAQWDGERIDGIAQALLMIERALARVGCTTVPPLEPLLERAPAHVRPALRPAATEPGAGRSG